MKPSTTIQDMLAGNRIFVPTYQRAYSWDTETDSSKTPKQVNQFLLDLEEYNRSKTNSSYYFGHFLFEEIADRHYGVIDGQQRMTTIVIFLSALFKRLSSLRDLSVEEKELKEDMIIRNHTYRFETVDYDKRLFKDYVVDQIIVDKNGLETSSAKRIVRAFDYFTENLNVADEAYLLQMLSTIKKASCTTHPVKDESEAIQMFIFQNNRGKKPSNLEIIKAQFMFNVHLQGGEAKESLIEEIKDRFENIYRSISKIEYNINEDEILIYTLRVYFNSLTESNAIERINKLLSKGDPIPFIKSFTQSLATSFDKLTTFFTKDEKEQMEIHSLISLGGIGIAIPFIIKAYSFGLGIGDINLLCSKLEAAILRDKLIGTRADLSSRLRDVYQNFTIEKPSINPIAIRIDWMHGASADWWFSYWNKEQLAQALQGGIHHATAKFLLWKYENHLKSQGNKGYVMLRYSDIIKPELEHIAPQTPTDGKPLAAGYCEYDEEFKQQYLHSLGNYLLISKSHNCSVGNIPFAAKRSTYKELRQQEEIRELTISDEVWDKSKIKNRHDKIVSYLVKSI